MRFTGHFPHAIMVMLKAVSTIIYSFILTSAIYRCYFFTNPYISHTSRYSTAITGYF